MSDYMTEKGLYNKYKIINNETGLESEDKFFVLKPDSDQAARSALRAYANATDNKELAKDLLHWADHKFVTCGCREAMCGHLFGGWEVERNEVDPLITTIESQKEEIERLHDALISIVDGNWSCLFHENGLEVWSTDRINPSSIAFQAISYKQEGEK